MDDEEAYGLDDPLKNRVAGKPPHIQGGIYYGSTTQSYSYER